MKVLIISDINSNVESIIPYGLHFGKFMETTVDILHTVDSRSVQGATSSYGDSQSITPGNKLSHDKIIEREKKNSEASLQKILSAEGSRLNYPLKYNTIIEETSIESKLKSISEEGEDVLVLINVRTKNSNFSSVKEIIDIVKANNGIYLLLHPGQVFHEFERVLLPTEFSAEDLDKYPNVSYLFKGFKPNINAVDVAKNEDYLGTEMKSSQWEKSAKTVFSESIVTSTMLSGKNYNETLINYITKDNPELVLLFKKEKSLLERLFKKDLLKEILEKTDVPVLFNSNT